MNTTLNVALLSLGLLAAPWTQADPLAKSKPASATTLAVQRSVSPSLLANGIAELDAAQRGFIGALAEPVIRNAQGGTVWDLRPYRFIDEAKHAPDSVHPALWQQAKLNNVHGLFKAGERTYQVRGYDVDNLTIVEGDTGLILIDPMTFTDSAKQSLDLYYQHRPKKPVVAVIYSHSHVDHFGGVRGVVDSEDVKSGKVQIWAPDKFMEEAIGENVTAGNAMTRRAQYQFGILLPRGERGQVDVGLGKGVGVGNVSLIAPTHYIKQAHETHAIDGIEIEFTLTPHTEAPSEMIMYFPQLRVLNMAELACQVLHNLLPIRGAQVRDSRGWAGFLNEALHTYAAKSDVMVVQHNWPVFGSERISAHLAKQRDTYKFVHDQTVRLMNHGYTAPEIADMVKLPKSLADTWGNQPFYAGFKHNVKAVYQRYLGWYDANPANLDALPPQAAAKKAVEYMGGAEAALKRAREDFAKGEYRWVAQLGSQLVYADPGNQAARELAADAYEQLGYQAQSGTWRSAYLQGALELRNGLPQVPPLKTASPDTIRALPLADFFDYMAIRLNGDKAEGKRIVLNWNFTDTQQRFVLNLENSALTTREEATSPEADATVTLTRDTLDRISLQEIGFLGAVMRGLVKVEGERPGALRELFGMLDEFTPMFNIIEPRPDLR